MPPKEMTPLGQVTEGAEVECPREAGDDEFELCKVKSLDAGKGLLDLDFSDGFVRRSVPVAEVRFLEHSLAKVEAGDVPASAAADAAAGAAAASDDAAYAAEVAPQLPAPPTAAALAADTEAKYAYIKAYKDVGNALFKAGKFVWAIRTYTAAVDALAQHCYESRERMLWDYFARVPCGQCYSNAALCALKHGDAAGAASLCERAMACKPEETDLVKVLLRHGQALLALGEGERAKAVLERAANAEPNNRAVREELLKAKKAAAKAAKAAAAALFQSVDLTSTGLTTKKQVVIEQLQSALDTGFDALVEHRDAEALELLAPMLEAKTAEAPHRRPATMLAAYGVGVARYQMEQLDEAAVALTLFFDLKKALDTEGVEYTPPLMGIPLARFYLAHTLFEKQKLVEAKEVGLAYLEDVVQAGPQAIINMPNGMLGRIVSDAERAASRFKTRASSKEAQADAYTMLAIVAERLEGPAATVPHFEKTIELGNDKQQAEAHDNLARTYHALQDSAKHAEHVELSKVVRERIAAAEEAARRKKEEEAAKEREEGAPDDESGGVAAALAGGGDERVPDVSEAGGS